MDMELAGAIIAKGMDELGEALGAGQLDLLLRYVAEIERHNEARGLVNAAGEGLIVRHILDSLAPLPLLRRVDGGGALCDLGSGAGLPGIPLAIMMPGRKVALVERSPRRARFLAGCVAALGLAEVGVLELDAGRAPAGAYGLAVARGFTEIDAASLAAMRRLLAPGGAIACYRDGRREIEEELARVPGTPAEILALRAPFLDEDRHLLVFRR